MLQTTLLAGDSDTNAAIVGGVIGAYVGVDNIDNMKRKKLLECRLEFATKKFVKDRPKFIQPAKGCINEMISLVAMAPSSLEIETVYKS